MNQESTGEIPSGYVTIRGIAKKTGLSEKQVHHKLTLFIMQFEWLKRRGCPPTKIYKIEEVEMNPVFRHFLEEPADSFVIRRPATIPDRFEPDYAPERPHRGRG